MRSALIVAGLSFVGCSNAIAPIDVGSKACSATQPCDQGTFCVEGYCLRAETDCNLDGNKDPNEECDDGNSVNDDACTNGCRTAFCGDGIHRRDRAEDHVDYEECDQGTLSSSQFCSDRCRIERPPIRLATAPTFTCLGRDHDIVCWGEPWDQPAHGPVRKSMPEGYGKIEGISIMKWNLNLSASNSLSPFLMVQVSPGVTAYSPWITDPSILENGVDDLDELFFWQNQQRLVYFRTTRSKASDHRGQFAYGRSDDRAFCWVNESNRLLCNRRGDCRAAPQPQIDGSNYHGTDLSRLGPMSDVALSQAVACAAQMSGQVLCWGDLEGYGRPDRSVCVNERGRAPGQHASERTIQGLEDIVAVSAGDYAFLGLTKDGGVFEWGWGWRLGELIDPPEYHEFDEPVARITNAVQTRCVLLQSGRVGCWGLHNGSPDGSNGRVHWLNLPSVKELSDGWSSHHVCALTVDDEVFCWGRNEYNQLGDGRYRDQPEPIRVWDLPRELRP